MIKTERLRQVSGQKLLDWDHNDKENSGSGAEEVVLIFTNGKEISIYIHDNGTLCIEGD